MTLAATAICGGIGMKKDELFQEIDGGRPTPEQAARMIELAMGDTSNFMLDSDEPNVAADAGAGDAGEASADAADQADNTEQNTDAQQGAGDAGASAGGDQQGKTPDAKELNAENAVILAKDGKHTIGYEKLVEARQGEQHWKAQAQAAQAELQRLRDEAAARATAGEAPTSQDNQLAAAQAAMDQGVDPAIFGDFSEEALAAGIQKLIDAKVDARVSALVDQKLAPIQKKEAESAASAHLNAIYEAHPDADSIAESKEFGDWVASRPSYERASIAKVLEAGTAADVIELFGSFKSATGNAQQSQQQPNAQDAKAAAQAAINKAKTEPPASLSDIPGGKPPAGNRFEAIAAMDPASMSDALRGMSPDQVEAFLNRNM
ncbi:hypothetical protein UJK07_04930 [Pseudomonas aeruginosa]|uniref:hypothetical protein n=1 Tax=Pseudomonas aeruginosa TaxID=287 RepID=UPI001F08E797|nr:hypothetical protein [Pseudomonas aeruginosa]MCW3900395.1 hypothetical protein [Pseudomonas aeruginosa]MED5111285.1 hypothetical protein [Pseudomonas aeruginosa]MED5122918.1 hypothetical protein [Pseudomonas aeruginosa]